MKEDNQISGAPSTSNSENVPQSSGKVYPSIEKDRLKRAYNLALIGFLSVISLTIFLTICFSKGFDKSDSVVSIVQPFLTLLGTLVGTFFGIQVGSSGKEELAEQAKDANDKVVAFAASIEPKNLNAAIDAYKSMK